MRALLADLSTDLVADACTHESLAAKAIELLGRGPDLSEACAASTARFDLTTSAERLIGTYEAVREALASKRRERQLR